MNPDVPVVAIKSMLLARTEALGGEADGSRVFWIHAVGQQITPPGEEDGPFFAFSLALGRGGVVGLHEATAESLTDWPSEVMPMGD